MAKKIWHPETAFRAYELAKAGMAESHISKALGIHVGTFRKWQQKKTSFRTAIRMGREVFKGRNGKGFNFRHYVYDRLPTELQDLWDEINELDGAKCGIEKIQALLKGRGKRVRQHLFIYAWTSSLFSISKAIRMVGITRTCFTKWCEEDPEFMKLVEEINFHKKNFFEDQLINLVSAGDSPATIQANKSFNKDRGYGDKVNVDVNVRGQIAYTFAVIKIGDLDLPLSTKKQILKAMRNRSKFVESHEVKSLT